MPARNDAIKSNIDSLLLCLINGQPMYGYQIIKELENRSQGYFKFKEGRCTRFTPFGKHGLIEGKWKSLPSGQQRNTII